jgi:hypothetical protein
VKRWRLMLGSLAALTPEQIGRACQDQRNAQPQIAFGQIVEGQEACDNVEGQSQVIKGLQG